MAKDLTVMDGVVQGGAIRLTNGPALPEGARVRVTVVPEIAPTAIGEIERLCAELRTGKPLTAIWSEIEPGRADAR